MHRQLIKRGGKMERSHTLRAATRTSLRDFQVTGMLGDEVVRALFEDGRLFVDGRLLTHAMLLVELGEVVRVEELGFSVKASLDGSPYAALITLLGACDRIISAAFDIDDDTVS
jgi:hypothetical protein